MLRWLTFRFKALLHGSKSDSMRVQSPFDPPQDSPSEKSCHVFTSDKVGMSVKV